MKRSILFLIMFTALSMLVSTQAWAVGTVAGTLIENQAYSDYDDANGNALPRVYSNTVTTEVSQVGGLLLEPPTASKTGTAGTNVYFAATVHNEGNGTDVYDLSAGNDKSWITTIYQDDNQDGIWDSATETTEITTTGSIAADGQEYVIVVVSVPGVVPPAPDDSSIATLTATSQFDNSITDSSDFTTTALDAALEITKTASPTAPEDGDVITYAITGKNLGSADALNVNFVDVIPANTTYVAESMRVGPVGGSYATAGAQTDASDGDFGYYNSGSGQVELAWGTEPAGGAGGVFYFQVRVDDDVSAGTDIANTGTANYQLTVGGTTYNTQSNESNVTVDSDASVLLDPDRSSSGDPSDEIVYAFTVYNNGNATDVIDLTYTSNSGWTYVFWEDVDLNGIPGTDGDSVLTDTDGDGTIDTGGITQGGSLPVLAVVTIPAGTADGTTETAVVTGTSSLEPGDADGSDIETLTTTVTAPVLGLNKAVSPTGPQPPGTELTYTVTVTNNGTGAATAVVISDIIPTYTTYKAGSISAGSTVGTLTSKTDANDGDGARYDSLSGAVIVPDGSSLSLGPGGTYVVRFTVTID
ncbi:hypothetical protein ACFL1N_01475 [Thermodesulfobacteriota bacterium]